MQGLKKFDERYLSVLTFHCTGVKIHHQVCSRIKRKGNSVLLSIVQSTLISATGGLKQKQCSAPLDAKNEQADEITSKVLAELIKRVPDVLAKILAETGLRDEINVVKG